MHQKGFFYKVQFWKIIKYYSHILLWSVLKVAGNDKEINWHKEPSSDERYYGFQTIWPQVKQE